MKREEILDTIIMSMKEILDVEGLEITEETTVENLGEWDSVIHMTLLATLEEELGIEFSFDEIKEIDSIKKLVEYIEKSMNGKRIQLTVEREVKGEED